MFALSKTGTYYPISSRALTTSNHQYNFKSKINNIFLELENTLNTESMYRGSESFKAVKIEPSLKALLSGALSLLSTFQTDEVKKFRNRYMHNLYVNTKLLINNGYKVEADLLFNLLADSSSKNLMIGSYSLIASLLARHVKDLNKTDVNGWTLHHWAAFQKNSEVIQELFKRGVDSSLKDNEGLTPLDLACWTMDRRTIKYLNPNTDPQELLSKLQPTFFKETVKKLKLIEQNNPKVFNSTYSTLLAESLPDLSAINVANNLSKSEINYLKLYYPYYFMPSSQLYSSYSPMGLAVRQQDLSYVKFLVDKGWTQEIEDLYNVRQKSFRKVVGYQYAISNLDNDSKNTQKQAIEMVSNLHKSSDLNCYSNIIDLIKLSKMQDIASKEFGKKAMTLIENSS